MTTVLSEIEEHAGATLRSFSSLCTAVYSRSMSAFLALFIYIVHIWRCHGGISALSVNSITISSSIDGDNNCLGETLIIYEISVFANNQELSASTDPVVSNIANEEYINDGSVRYGSHSTDCSFSITYDFGEATDIEIVKLQTNCGDSSPSDFCNEIDIYFDPSGTISLYDQYYAAGLWPVSALRMALFTYQGLCDANELVFDTDISPCNVECEECMENLDVNEVSTRYWTLESFTDNSSSTCDCPSFTMQVQTDSDHTLDIYTDCDELVGVMAPYSSVERVQLTWTSWNGTDLSCRKLYMVEQEDFLTIPSYQGIVCVSLCIGMYPFFFFSFLFCFLTSFCHFTWSSEQ